ncbi:3224_t:CDS:2 [Paraglomus brasilianum]|uniref:3224_t:CDS:1 n=1 Tax=Paraglomus brasilianum TaxID=144538 RepID=A0A9N9AE68_9GLOM|nr:3224_t:CDS:2 [Paraglomus brasilianum]
MLSYLTQLVAEYLPSTDSPTTDSPTHTDSALKKRFAPYTKPEAMENESQSAIPNNNDGQASSTQTSGIHEDNMPLSSSPERLSK